MGRLPTIITISTGSELQRPKFEIGSITYIAAMTSIELFNPFKKSVLFSIKWGQENPLRDCCEN
jgi:hypothetical protein